MKGDPWTPEGLLGLSGLSAAELAERLSRYFESVGGLVFRAEWRSHARPSAALPGPSRPNPPYGLAGGKRVAEGRLLDFPPPRLYNQTILTRRTPRSPPR
jgi:hypothetical protein